MQKKENHLDVASFQLRDGSFRLPAELHSDVHGFFLANEQRLGTDFCFSFAERFGIGDFDLKDRHYTLYQNILYRYDSRKHTFLQEECRVFSDPLANSLLLRRANIRSHPGRFISLNIWDTCYCAWFLLNHGKEDAARRAVGWLLAQQSSSGGWSCSTEYPLEDSDTTAAIIILLKNFEKETKVVDAVTKGFHWLNKLITPDGSVKTFDEQFGVPTNDTTALALVAWKLWGHNTPHKCIEWLEGRNESHWYSSSCRLRSCTDYLGLTTSLPKLSGWGAEMQNARFNIRFIGDVRLNSALWSASINSLRMLA